MPATPSPRRKCDSNGRRTRWRFGTTERVCTMRSSTTATTRGSSNVCSSKTSTPCRTIEFERFDQPANGAWVLLEGSSHMPGFLPV